MRLRRLRQGLRNFPEAEACLKAQRCTLTPWRLVQPQPDPVRRGSRVPIVWNAQFLVARQPPPPVMTDVFPSRDAPPGGSTKKAPWEEAAVNAEGRRPGRTLEPQLENAGFPRQGISAKADERNTKR